MANHAHNSSCSHASGSSHSHQHHHFHGGRAFGIAIVLNVAFVVMEFMYGFMAHSMALVADAGHNLSDVFALVLASWAAFLMRRPPDQRYTYGLRGSSILAALVNAGLLLVACGAIAWEALRRLVVPVSVDGVTVSLVAGVGILVNSFSAWLFFAGSKEDLNVRGAFLHMLADAVISLGVVVSGVVILFTGWDWLDPFVSLAVVMVILWGSWGLLRDSLNLALHAVPAHIDITAVQEFLCSLPGVVDVHDLHIWGMSTRESALTVHLVLKDGHPGQAFINKASQQLQDRFSIHHSTLQIELGDVEHGCNLRG